MILDSCALLAWVYTPDVLSTPTRTQISAALQRREAGFCAISIWEIVWKHRLGTLPLVGGPETFDQALKACGFLAHAVDYDLWWQMARLDWEHRDPADRLVVCLARRRSGTVIVTNDRAISAFHPRCVW